MDAIPGSGDCEAHIAVWGQPALLASSAAYLVAALFVVVLMRRRGGGALLGFYAAGLALTGLGSMDYHGPAVGPQPLLHDSGLALALLAALTIDLQQLRGWRPGRAKAVPAAALAALLMLAVAFHGTARDSLAVLTVLVAVAVPGLIAAEILVYRRGLRRTGPALLVGAGALAAGALLYALSRTGGPLCEPGSMFQGHAAWHILTAVALAAWAVTTTNPGAAADGSLAGNDRHLSPVVAGGARRDG